MFALDRHRLPGVISCGVCITRVGPGENISRPLHLYKAHARDNTHFSISSRLNGQILHMCAISMTGDDHSRPRPLSALSHLCNLLLQIISLSDCLKNKGMGRLDFGFKMTGNIRIFRRAEYKEILFVSCATFTSESKCVFSSICLLHSLTYSSNQTSLLLCLQSSPIFTI